MGNYSDTPTKPGYMQIQFLDGINLYCGQLCLEPFLRRCDCVKDAWIVILLFDVQGSFLTLVIC